MVVDEFIERIDNLSQDEVLDILSALRKKEYDNSDRKVRNSVNSHKEYVGKCYYKEVQPKNGMFPSMKKYYKIISERGSNEYRISALTFYEHPFYWFEYNSHKIAYPGDYFLGEYDFNGIDVEDFGAFCYTGNGGSSIEINELTEISLEEYNLAMNKYIKELQEMEWPSDHWRYGRKLPSDPEWERKD